MTRVMFPGLTVVPLIPAPASWRSRLQVSSRGVKSTLFNASLYLKNDPDVDVVLDILNGTFLFRRPPPWAPAYVGAIRDEDATLAAIHYSGLDGAPFDSGCLQKAIAAHAIDNIIDPVRDYLESLVWDQVPRIDTWLINFLSVEDRPANRFIGSKWMIAAVSRALNPGRQADHMLVLEGDQGVGKSTALRILASDKFYSEEPLNVRDKDGMVANFGCWIREVSELAGMERQEVSLLKQFISKREDKFRMAYGHFDKRFPRRIIFSGTTNRSTYLKDDTGNRRFWPVLVGKTIKFDELTAARDQLWAEAVVRFKAGETWWPNTLDQTQALTTLQTERLATDPWEETLAKGLADYDRATVNDALEVMNISPEKRERKHSERALEILKRIGFTTMVKEQRQVFWCREARLE